MDLDELLDLAERFASKTFSTEPEGKEPTVVFTCKPGKVEVLLLGHPTLDELKIALGLLVLEYRPQHYVIFTEGRYREIPLDDFGLKLKVRPTDPELLILAGVTNGGPIKTWTACIDRGPSGERSLQPWEEVRDPETNLLVTSW